MQRFRSQSRLLICKPASLPIPILLACILFLNFSLICAAAIIKVPENYSTIQSAIDAAFDGDEIIVSPATYYENINFNGKNIILRSTDPTSPTVVASTIIDGNQAGSVVTFAGTELATCVLSGFTITNGYASDGGGICGNGTLATIQYNTITLNTTYGPLSVYVCGGGGIYDCNGTIQSNTISDNSASTRGGGLGRCDGTIQSNAIFRNSAGISGGGLFECNGIIQNNTISNNSAKWGGGLYDCMGAIQNNLISSNSAAGSMVSHGGGVIGCDGIIQNNTILENTAKYGGGGLAGCNGLIQHNLIAGNSVSSMGGGLIDCNGTVQNNRITSNTATYAYSYGGGLARCYATIQNNLIANNSAGYGGGLAGTVGVVYIDFMSANSSLDPDGRAGHTTGILQNNTITNNSAQYGGGIYLYEGFIVNCIIWGNSVSSGGSQIRDSKTPLYSCIQGWSSAGTGNISEWPLLSDPDNGDFHLDYGSPCIDAGCYVDDLAEDFEGDFRGYDGSPEARGDGSDYDIGADEFIAIPSIDPPHKPSNLSPANGETGVALPPILESSAFSDPDPGDIHTASQWQIDNNSNFSSPEYDSFTDFFNKTTIIALSEDVIYCTEYYYWRVRHRDNHGYWSEWSDATSFLTLPPAVISVPGDYFTIQEAIDAAWGGDIIIVFPGRYRENINFKSKNIILRSSNPTSASVVASTIIDGSALGSVVTFSGTESSLCVLSGFTITNGKGSPGGGIYGNFTLATIQNNTISDNSATYAGGLYRCDGVIKDNIISGNSGGGLGHCSGTIQNNTISGNSGDDGGGLCGCYGTIQNNFISGNSARLGGGLANCGTIQNNIISDNSARRSGGGLYGCNATVQNNIISDNSAGRNGGGLYLCDATVQNNMIYGNVATERGGGLRGCHGTIQNNTIYGNSASWDGGGLRWCEGTIRNCIIWQNIAPSGPQLDDDCSTPSYSCIQDWTGGGTGNITSDPQLVDPENADFHLLASSPCIDAGGTVTLAQDFEGDPRPWDGTSELRGDGSDFDIGADEFIGSITYDFIDSEEGWTPGSAIIFSLPQYLREAGSLKIISQDNTNTFGFWGSPEDAIPATAGYLYRARFIVSTDVALPELVPQIRLRVNSRNFQQADCLTIDSNGDGGASPTPEGTSYDLYFVPPANEQFCMLAFDLLNFNPYDAAHAELALESVLVERFALGTLDESTTITWAYDFESSQEFWSTGDGTLVFTDPEFFWADGALHLQSMTNTNTFGFWHNDPIDIIIEADRLYRGTFDVRTDEPERSLVPQMRLRFNTANLQACRSLEISSSGDGANSPGTTNTIYDRLYFLPPANCVGRGLIISFDMLNFDPDDAAEASLILDRAIIETLLPPALP